MARLHGPLHSLSFTLQAAPASDPALARLIQKLPSPEKFVDPAIRDPLIKQIQAATKARNYGSALALSRQLAKRYPRSAAAQMTQALYALSMRETEEARQGFKRTLALSPNAAGAFLGLGAAEFSQERYGSALQQFQNMTRVAPQADVGWIGSSLCAGRLGRKTECLRFARRAVEVAPKSVGAWNNLARQESLYGSQQAAGGALQRANLLAAAARKR